MKENNAVEDGYMSCMCISSAIKEINMIGSMHFYS